MRCGLERVSSFSSLVEFVARTVSRFLFSFERVSAVKNVVQHAETRNCTEHSNFWPLVFLLLRRREGGHIWSPISVGINR